MSYTNKYLFFYKTSNSYGRIQVVTTKTINDCSDINHFEKEINKEINKEVIIVDYKCLDSFEDGVSAWNSKEIKEGENNEA